jgi:ectoine hydroxylase-related dioxygenase (phytanoyl-CoA dioxygenase family)
MNVLARVSSSEPIERVVGALKEHGAVIVEDMIDPGLLTRFNAELDPVLKQAHQSGVQDFINDTVAWFFGNHARHMTGLGGKSRLFATEILTHPVYLAVCDAVLARNCARYQLNLAHVLDRGPGSEPQLLHRDEDVWIHMPKPHPEIQLASMLALVDFTADNGATRIVPGSHRWEPGRQANDEDIVAAEMPAGSAVIYLGSTVHAAGANTTTDTWRRGMHLSYCLGWLRTEENQCLTTPIEVVRGLPRQAQELLGFGAHDAIKSGGGYLGAVELQDPVELIANGKL